MTDYTNDIKRYLSGEMTPAEKHALEKKALTDPLLADALEGASLVGYRDFAADVAELNRTITEKQDHRIEAAAAPAERRRVRKVTVTRWVLRVAAGLVLLIAATFIIRQFTRQPEPAPLAIGESVNDKTRDGAEDGKVAKEQESASAIPEAVAPQNEISAASDKPGKGGNTYPVDAKAKPTERLAEANTEKADDQHLAEQAVAPVLAQEAKPKTETGNLQPAEKPAELALADKPEEEVQRANVQADTDRKKTSGAARSTVQQGQYVIQGRVTSSEDGSPLPGVNVVIKGTNIGTVTDAAGNYQIQSDKANPSLVFSFIDFRTQEVNAGERRRVDMQMNLDVAQLSEVVVTGYGIQNNVSYTPTVELAHPVTGNRAFKQYLESNLRYPKEALEKKIKGRVTVEFFVEPNGDLSGFSIIRGIGAGCDEEVIRLIREGPAWVPTQKDGVPIRDKARVLLKFELPKKL